METTHWTKLIVTDVDGASEELGNILRGNPEILRRAVVKDGMIAEWMNYFLAAPGEDPEWDTPRGPVDWTGFVEATYLAALAAQQTR